MARNKKKEEPTVESMSVVRDERKLAIREIKLKDDFAHLTYEVLHGPGSGDKIKREGSKPVHPDLIKAFKVLHVHMANYLDIFAWASIEFKDIDTMHDHSITDRFWASGFKLSGNDENLRVIITGSYTMANHPGHINVVTPPIGLTTSYLYFNELKTAVDKIIQETELYLAGKWDPSVKEIDNQTELFTEEDGDDSFAEAEQ